MRTSAPGNRRRSAPLRPAAAAGFTLLELLVVVAVIALASGLSVMALRDGSTQRLEEEAVRLSALLEAARLESRTSGRTLVWRPQAASGTGGFVFDEPDRTTVAPMSDATAGPRGARGWLHAGTSAEVIGAAIVVLGPDPILRPQRVRLRQGERELVIATDGLGPFQIDATGSGR